MNVAVLPSPSFPASLSASKRTTKLSFFIAGFALAAWAPLVPHAQQRLNADAAMLGLLLLCLGLGAVIGMPLAGALAGRVGVRLVTLFAGSVLVCVFPLLAVANTPLVLALSLLIFGASIGAIDVAANVHGSQVQSAATAPLMSGFHGLYSVGCLIGAASVTGAMVAGVSVVVAAAAVAVVVACCLWRAGSGFLPRVATVKAPWLIRPRGKVLLIGALAMVIFLGEGAMLDWAALLLVEDKGVAMGSAGAGYAVFTLAMTSSRIIGDRMVGRIGERSLLAAGYLFSSIGLAVAALSSVLSIVFIAMAIAGFAAGNVVPLLLSMAGRQRMMPAAHAIAAATTLGYLGVLFGPALVGYAAHAWGLTAAFLGIAAVLAATLLLLPIVSSHAAGPGSCDRGDV